MVAGSSPEHFLRPLVYHFKKWCLNGRGVFPRALFKTTCIPLAYHFYTTWYHLCSVYFRGLKYHFFTTCIPPVFEASDITFLPLWVSKPCRAHRQHKPLPSFCSTRVSPGKLTVHSPLHIETSSVACAGASLKWKEYWRIGTSWLL